MENGNKTQALGILEDVIVKVNPYEFYILDLHNESVSQQSTLILDKPFLKTIKTKINVQTEMFSMEFGEDNHLDFPLW